MIGVSTPEKNTHFVIKYVAYNPYISTALPEKDFTCFFDLTIGAHLFFVLYTSQYYWY